MNINKQCYNCKKYKDVIFVKGEIIPDKWRCFECEWTAKKALQDLKEKYEKQ